MITLITLTTIIMSALVLVVTAARVLPRGYSRAGREQQLPSASPHRSEDEEHGWIQEPGPFEVTLRQFSAGFKLVHPSSATGPDLFYVPYSGHHVVLEVNPVEELSLPVRIAISARVTRRSPPGEGALAHGGPWVPGATPHLEVLLDEKPPVVRPAQHSDGALAHPEFSMPLVVEAAGSVQLLIAPVTDSDALVWWRLCVEFAVDEHQWRLESPAMCVTTNMTWRTYKPGGGEPERSRDPFAWEHWPPARR